MCGICGTYNLIDEQLLKRMCGTIAHRGPDDEGQYIDDQVMLGMRRLKIIDLHTGNQPIFNEDKSIVIVFNGEIYNFQDNRRLLEDKGHRFKTDTDTETIVHLYEEFGDDFVKKLRGMFAFALWDIKKERLILARDRIGIKPLYYHFKNGTLLFASELKSILEYPNVSREINFDALHDYLTYMYVPSPDTIFSGIYKLEPGHLLILDKGSLKNEKYWDLLLDSKNNNNLQSEDEVSENLYKLMKESIRMHLISDVPLGVFLSGGMDSGTIVSILSGIIDKPIKTFSIGFEEREYSELDNARLVAKRFGTEHHEHIVTSSSIEDIEEILNYFDEPFADSSSIPTYYLSKHTRENVTVALSGDGGDELFGGYGNYKANKIGMIFRRFPGILKENLIPFCVDRFIRSHNHYSRKDQIRKIMEAAKLTPEEGHIFWLHCFGEDQKKEIYSSDLMKKDLKSNSIKKHMRFFEQKDCSDFLNRAIYTDIKTILPDDYLKKVDMMSMANSLEVRVPFLDHKLVEFCLSIPGNFKLNGLTSKYILKKIMKDKLPDEVIKGKKKGFSIPLSKWFTEDFGKLFDRYLSKEIVRKRGYFNIDSIERLTKEHLNGQRDNSKQLWTLICFEIWHRKYVG